MHTENIDIFPPSPDINDIVDEPSERKSNLSAPAISPYPLDGKNSAVINTKAAEQHLPNTDVVLSPANPAAGKSNEPSQNRTFDPQASAKLSSTEKLGADSENNFRPASLPAGDKRVPPPQLTSARPADSTQTSAQTPPGEQNKSAVRGASPEQPAPLTSQVKPDQSREVSQLAKPQDARLAPTVAGQTPQETGRLINGQEVKAQHPVFGPTSAVLDKTADRSTPPGQNQGVLRNDLFGKGLEATAPQSREFPQSAQALATRPAPIEPGAYRADQPAVPDLPGRVASIRPEDLGKLPGEQLKTAKPEPGLRQPDFKPEFKPDLKTDLKSLDGKLGEPKLPIDKTMSGRLPEGGKLGTGIPMGNTAVPWRSVGDRLDDIVKRMEQGGRRAESGRANDPTGKNSGAGKDWAPGSRRSDVSAPWGGRSPLAGPKDGEGKPARAGKNDGGDGRGERAPKPEGEKPGRTISVDGPKLRGIPVGADLKVRLDDWRQAKSDAQGKQETVKNEVRSTPERVSKPYVSGEAPARQYTLKIDNSRSQEGERSPVKNAKTDVPIPQPQSGVESIKNFIGRMKDQVEHALAPWKSETGRAVDDKQKGRPIRPVEMLGIAKQLPENKNEYVLPNSKDKLPITHKEMNTAVLIAVLISAGDKGRQVVRQISTSKIDGTADGEKTHFATNPETTDDTVINRGNNKPFIRLHLPDGTYGGDKVEKDHRVAEMKIDVMQDSETVPLKHLVIKETIADNVREQIDTPAKTHQESERRYVNPAMDALEQTWSSEDDEPGENGTLAAESLNADVDDENIQGGLSRYRLRVGPNESVESIALNVLKDAGLAPLLFKMVRQHVLPEKEYGVHPLPEGIVIDLPTPSEIAEFRRTGQA